MTTNAAKRLTAVVVDDATSQGSQLAQILTKLGVDVVAICESGPAGIAAIRKHRPTIATIDNQMPGTDGLTVIRTLVAEKTPTLLVMCSGTSQAVMKENARVAGAIEFIVKPYDNVLTGRALQSVLSRSKR